MGADAPRAARGCAAARHVPRRRRAVGRSETAAGVRGGGDAAPRPRPPAGDLPAVVSGAAPGAGDTRPGELLAWRVCRGAQGLARPLPQARLAGESARCAAAPRSAPQPLTLRKKDPDDDPFPWAIVPGRSPAGAAVPEACGLGVRFLSSSSSPG